MKPIKQAFAIWPQHNWQRRTLLFFSLAWLVIGAVAHAQMPFAPPRAPRVSSQSAEIGEAPARTTAAAQVPPFNSQAPTNPQAPVASRSLDGAKPLVGGQIVARFDGQVVLASDVLWQVNMIIDQNRDKIPPGQEEDARRMLLRQQVMGLLDTKLLYADFRRNVPAENLPKIEENLMKPFEESEIPRLMKILEVKSRDELAEMLEKNGSSFAAVQRQFIERTIAGEWLRQRLPQSKPVTHEQMLDHYKGHRKEYDFPAQARWEELMVRFDRFGGDRAKAWRAIAEMGNEVWQQVASKPNVRGAVFTEIAKAKSHGFTAKEGGLHDWTTLDSLRCQEINDALFSLQLGQFSNIIESEQGFHIVRVLQRKKSGCMPFTKAQSGICKKIIAEQKKGVVAKELAKLRKDCRVWTVFDGNLGAEQLARSATSDRQPR